MSEFGDPCICPCGCGCLYENLDSCCPAETWKDGVCGSCNEGRHEIPPGDALRRQLLKLAKQYVRQLEDDIGITEQEAWDLKQMKEGRPF